MRRGRARAAAALMAIAATAGAAAASWAYFSATHTNPQPISLADFGGANIKYETASTPAFADLVNVAVPAPPGVQPGWLLVAVIGFESDDPIVTPPAGWTLIRASRYTGGQVSMHSFWHVAGATEPPSYTFTLSTRKRSYAGIVAYSGVTAANPIATSVGSEGHSLAATAPSATAGSYDTRWIFAATFDSKDPLTFSPDVTKRWSLPNLGGENTGVADAALKRAASTPPATVQGNGSQEWVAQTIVLNAAP